MFGKHILWFPNDIITAVNSDKILCFIWSVPELCGRYPKLCKGNSFLRVLQCEVKLNGLG